MAQPDYKPAPGDFLWCRLPYEESDGGPGKGRVVLVLNEILTITGDSFLEVAYCTSRHLDDIRKTEVAIRTGTPEHAAVGNDRSIKVCFQRRAKVPYTTRYFMPPPGGLLSKSHQTTRVGSLHPQLMKRVEAAFRSALEIERIRAQRAHAAKPGGKP